MTDDKTESGETPAGSTPAKAKRGQLRKVRGIVVSDKMQNTLVVQVNRKVRHPLYEKFVSKRTKLFVHDDVGEAKEGDTVEICRTRRVSKLKNWRLVRLVQKAAR